MIWTPEALPSVVRLTTLPEMWENTARRTATMMPDGMGPDGDYSFRHFGETFRFFVQDADKAAPAALLPFDALIDIRAQAAVRLRRALAGEPAGRNPAALTWDRQARLVLALRALDARLEGATNREIAAGLFPHIRVPPEAWISHDLRDRTARLVRLGVKLMRGGYRQLLRYPHRARGPD